ncbi:MAG: OmpA family protein [Desulfobacteraceae bacterium]|jgi:hypothetical protein
MKQSVCCSALTVLLLFAVTVPSYGEDRTDLLDLASGAVLLSSTESYDEDWAALLVLNGTPKGGWCSPEGKAFPHKFVLELSSEHRITEFCIDNTHAQESGYPGISARALRLSTSSVSSKEGFQLAHKGEAAKGKRSCFTLDPPVQGRWLKLEILSNWGNPAYTEMMELEAYGEGTGRLTDQAPVNGVYKTNFNLMWLQQSGTDVEGCYDWDNGTLTGSTDGRVIRFQWVEDGPQIGTAVMVLTADGSVLNGLWYEQGVYRGLWFGNRALKAEVPACRALIKDNAIGHSLDTMGRAILYGIYFDYDSATLKPSSMNTLQQVLSALSARPEMKLVIEGHTDSQGSDDYNLDLSKRRAESVKTWLTDKGIAENRLEARGYGESRPVADNRQPDGRALNRRVEIAVTP